MYFEICLWNFFFALLKNHLHLTCAPICLHSQVLLNVLLYWSKWTILYSYIYKIILLCRPIQTSSSPELTAYTPPAADSVVLRYCARPRFAKIDLMERKDDGKIKQYYDSSIMRRRAKNNRISRINPNTQAQWTLAIKIEKNRKTRPCLWRFF